MNNGVNDHEVEWPCGLCKVCYPVDPVSSHEYCLYQDPNLWNSYTIAMKPRCIIPSGYCNFSKCYSVDINFNGSRFDDFANIPEFRFTLN